MSACWPGLTRSRTGRLLSEEQWRSKSLMRWQTVLRFSLELLVVRFFMFDVVGDCSNFSGKTSTTGGLGNTISDEDLKEFFGQFGNVVSVKQIKNKETGKHKVGIN